MTSLGTELEPAEYETLIRSAREVADELLERYFGLPIEKALDLHTRGGFDLTVARLAAELRRETTVADAEALRIAMRVLDVDWRHASAERRRELVARAMTASGRATASVPKRVKVAFGRKAAQILAATRRDGRGRQRLSIGADFNAVDRRIVDHVANSQALFVTDEYGRRQEEAGERARAVVAHGIEQGLGLDDIAADLHAELGQILTGRSQSYWDVVAGAFTASTRSYGQMSSYAEAGIRRYQISSVLDANTTETCRFLDGKTFDVSEALDRFDRIEQLRDPAAIKAASPWVREGADHQTGRRRLFVARGGADLLLAEVARSGTGRRDDRGEFSGGRSERELSALGISLPPFHGRCRSSTVPLT